MKGNTVIMIAFDDAETMPIGFITVRRSSADRLLMRLTPCR